MNRLTLTTILLSASYFSVSAFADTGEYWEVTSKMEMEGMPFSMPATTRKVCVPKGGENDPRKSAPNKDCEMSDVKFSGNKTSWKVRCNHNGDITEGTGEFTHSSDSYEGKMHMKSTSEGKSMEMNMALNGKRVGGSCEVGAEFKAMQKQACDTTGYTAVEWIGSADRFLHDSKLCPGKKEELCNAVRQDAPRKPDVYRTLVQMDQYKDNLVAKSCNLNMSSITQSVCATLTDDNFESMTQYCPAEAKKFMEERRKRSVAYTANRSFTAGRSYTAAQSAGQGSSPGSTSPGNKLLDSAKKLKGLFGF